MEKMHADGGQGVKGEVIVLGRRVVSLVRYVYIAVNKGFLKCQKTELLH